MIEFLVFVVLVGLYVHFFPVPKQEPGHVQRKMASGMDNFDKHR